MTQDQFLI